MKSFETTVQQPMVETERAVREALSKEGFGVLSEIDVAGVLKAKLGVDRRPLKILGACNPHFANRALEIDADIALVLPCNVVLEQMSDRQVRVAITDPRALLEQDGERPQDLEALGDEAAVALERVVGELRR